MSAAARLRLPTLLFYALPGLAFAMPTIPVYVYLPTYYADDLGLGLAVTGAILLAARAFDVVTDPLVGSLSDRWRTRWGRRKPWILAGAVLAAISLVQLLAPPSAVGPAFLFGWVITLFLGWTLVAIPYNAWGAEISADYHERARITGAREAATIFGVLTAGAVPAAIAALGGSEADALAVIAWMAVALGLPAVALLLWRVPDPPRETATVARRLPWRQLARELVANRPFLRLLSAWFINGLANGLPSVLFPLYLEYALGADAGERGILIFTYFLAGVLAIPVWLRISRRYGKHRTWCMAMALACAAFIWVPWLESGAIAAFFVVCVVTGVAFGADMALPPAMQADVIDLDTLRTRQQRAGLFFALWSMATKLALACAVGFAFPVLELFGFRPGADNAATALLALAVIYALLPTVLKVGAVLIVWDYPITEHRQQLIRRRIESRRVRAHS